MSRVDWILANHDLSQRLDRVWSGETWRQDDDAGLAATLDGIPEWDGWDSWDEHRQADELNRLLAQWEQAGDGSDEQLSEDTSQPRWNPGTESWELYNADRAQWWPYDADSGTWLDPVAQQWVAVHGNGAESGGAFDWVTSAQAAALTGRYGEGWAGELTAVLDRRWGPDWAAHPAEHKQAWLADLLPTLIEPEPAAHGEEDLVAPSIEFVELDDDDEDDSLTDQPELTTADKD